MHAERLLQIMIALQVALGTWLLGLGERTATLPVLATIVAASSVYVTDIRGWIRLAKGPSNSLAILFLGVAAWDAWRLETENGLLAVANLLVYLQFILQYQQKRPRTYWLLISLSLLQTAVATALSLQLVFGAILVAYMFVALASLMLLTIEQERRRAPVAASGVLAILTPEADRALPRSRWPLAGLHSALAAHSPSGDLGESVIAAGALRHVGLLGCGVLLLSGLVFFGLPRATRTPWRPTGSSVETVIGADDTVTLDEVTSVSQNPEEVMRVRFFDHAGNDVYRPLGNLYFRGLVLVDYARGAWRQHPADEQDAERLAPSPPPLPNLVRQEITIEPLPTNILYCVYPLDSSSNRNVLLDSTSRRLLRPRYYQSSRFSFDIVTSGFANSRQAPVTHEPGALPMGRLRQLSSAGFAGDRFPQLQRLAADTVRDLPEHDIIGRARALERYLARSNEFRYSYQFVRVDRDLDPIEDFLVNGRAGNCECFATALALMLRSVDIPARLIVGFKDGDWNRFGDFCQVRQLHAHAWVEAFVPSEALPADGTWQHGGWLRLDPTPAGGRGGQLAQVGPVRAAVRQLTDYAGFLWASYVLGMDSSKQQTEIYLPISRGVASVVAAITNRDRWELAWVVVKDLLGVDRWTWYQGYWFNWRAGLASMAVMLASVYLYRGLNWLLWRLGWRRLRPADSRDRRAVEVEFYRRLEQLLARRGLRRGSCETQREFALAAAGHLADSTETRAAARLPLWLAEAFYQVRFGRLPLDPVKDDAVRRALVELDAALAPRPSQ